jgi:hypothetical protein
LLLSKRTRQVLETEAGTAWKPSKRPAFDEIMVTAIKRQHEPQRIDRVEDVDRLPFAVIIIRLLASSI